MRTLEAGGSHLLAALVKGERTLSELSWHFALLLPRAVAVDIVALRSPMRHYSIGEKALEALQYSAEVRMEVRTLLEWRRQAFDTLAAVHDRQRDLLRSHLEDRFEDISGDVYEDGFEDDPEDDHESAGGAAVLLSGAGAAAVADAAALTAKADRWGDDAVRLRVRLDEPGGSLVDCSVSVVRRGPQLRTVVTSESSASGSCALPESLSESLSHYMPAACTDLVVQREQLRQRRLLPRPGHDRDSAVVVRTAQQ